MQKMSKTTLYYNKITVYDISSKPYEQAKCKECKEVYEIGFIAPNKLFQAIRQFGTLDELKQEYSEYKIEQYIIPKDESNTKKV